MTSTERIPFAIEIGRVIEVLAAQIYPSPFALLRENVQNAFDAVLLRRHLGDDFAPRIDVTISSAEISVADNGVGMTLEELRQNFWRAGASSKNTEEARAAGVVGTFGIGAMANFGIAEELIVESESARTHERTQCIARRSTLSVTDDCIEIARQESTGSPGTIVVARMQSGKNVDVQRAVSYLSEFVGFLPIAVSINGTVVSGTPLESAVPRLVETWVSQGRFGLGDGLNADVDLSGSITGDVRIALSSIVYNGQSLPGELLLRSGGGALRTFRSRFGLATASVSSHYAFGGAADFLFLQPTAGREALTIESQRLLQVLVTKVEDFVSARLAERPESNASAAFVAWAKQRARFDLCGNLRVRLEPGDSATLAELRDRSQHQKVLVYLGSDAATIAHASADKPMVVLTRNPPRRDCEYSFLRKYCAIEEMSAEPRVLREKPRQEWSFEESSIAFRVGSVLTSDYFVSADVRFGEISSGLPLLVIPKTKPVEIALDPSGATIKLLGDVYRKEYGAFDHLVKDFVRAQIFPKISELVPSATRQGAAEFLKVIQRNREVFEYEVTDQENLGSLWKDYIDGKVQLPEAANRAASIQRRSVQELDNSVSGSIRDVVPDVVDNAATLQSTAPQLGPAPPIRRPDISTDRKLLTVPSGEPALNGYHAFLAITDRVREERGATFFLQPHRTTVIWGGQRVLFVFEHHSGEFGLYYDIQAREPMADASGGGEFPTSTIVMKNRIFIPLPEEIYSRFIPTEGEKKRFEVRCDLLHTEKRAPTLAAGPSSESLSRAGSVRRAAEGELAAVRARGAAGELEVKVLLEGDEEVEEARELQKEGVGQLVQEEGRWVLIYQGAKPP